MPPLSGAGLSPALREQLRSVGIHTVEDVVGQDELVLAHRAHMSVEEVRTLQRSLRLAYAATPIPATLLLQQARAHQNSLGLSVGLTALDELLGGGGLRAGEVTEVVGGAAAGKTALCLQACASALADPTATVAFVDSANAFTPTRLLPLLPHADVMTAMSALARLRCWRVHDGQSLLALLHQLLDELASPHQEGDYARNLRLVVVDCVASLLAPLLSSASLGHSLVSGISRALRLLATRHNLVVLVTNYVVGGDEESRGVVKPALGESWGMTSATRLYVHRQASSMQSGADGTISALYYAALVKSSRQECTGDRVWFGIDGQGLAPLQDEGAHHHQQRMDYDDAAPS